MSYGREAAKYTVPCAQCGYDHTWKIYWDRAPTGATKTVKRACIECGADIEATLVRGETYDDV